MRSRLPLHALPPPPPPPAHPAPARTPCSHPRALLLRAPLPAASRTPPTTPLPAAPSRRPPPAAHHPATRCPYPTPPPPAASLVLLPAVGASPCTALLMRGHGRR